MREERALTQVQMARILSVAQTTYSHYELGKANIPIPILIALAKFHLTSIDYLLGLTDEKAPYPSAKKRR